MDNKYLGNTLDFFFQGKENKDPVKTALGDFRDNLVGSTKVVEENNNSTQFSSSSSSMLLASSTSTCGVTTLSVGSSSSSLSHVNHHMTHISTSTTCSGAVAVFTPGGECEGLDTSGVECATCTVTDENTEEENEWDEPYDP